jgi:hypothetical protein
MEYTKIKKYLAILFPIALFEIMFKNLKTISRIIVIAAIPLFVFTCIVDITLLFSSIVLWQRPTHWYFPFTGDVYLLMLDRVLLVLGIVISVVDTYKKYMDE